MSLVVGQKLWFVPYSRRDAEREVTVEKVGRKWATTERGLRLDLVTLVADAGGFTSPGRAYLDRAAYEAEVERQKAWQTLVCQLRHSFATPRDVSIEAIREAARLLGVQL